MGSTRVYLAVLVAVAHGVYGINQAEATWLYLDLVIPCFVMGILFPRYCLLSGGAVVMGEYLLHVIAIQFLGYEQPYVERNVASAVACFKNLPLCLIAGVGGWSIGVPLFERWRFEESE